MWNPSDTKTILRAWVAVCALALSGPALAQEPAVPPSATAPAAGRQELRQTIEKRYEILPLHNGVVLRPRKERAGVRTIELSGSTIAVNGERIPEGVLRAWLGAEEAAPVLRLFALSPRERQALFGLSSGDGAVEEEEVPAAPDAEGEVEIPAVGEDEAAPPAVPGVPAPPPAPEVPEEPETPEDAGAGDGDAPSTSTGSRVNLFGGINVAEDEIAEEAVAVLGSVRVDGEVERDVVAVGGAVTINGRVGGSVTAVGGSVRLGPKAVVDGDISSVGGTVIRAEGSRVHGQTSEVGMTPNRDWDEDVDITFHPWAPFLGGTLDLVWQLVGIAILALLVCLCILVARGPLEKVERHVRTEPWIAGLVGLLSQLLFLPLLLTVTVLLVITIVGCALIALYPFLFIALGLAALFGYAAVALRVGRFLETRFDRSLGSPYVVALAGVLAIEVWSILGRLVGLGGGVLEVVAFTILAFGFAVQYVAWTIGFGAVLLARFGGSRGRWSAAGAPPPSAPPPPPATPVPYDPVIEGPAPDPERPASV